MIIFEGDTANCIWKAAVTALIDMPQDAVITSRGGPVTELLHVGLSLFDPRQRWVSLRIPAINPAFTLAELVWIFNGCQEAEIINFWNPALPRFAGKSQNYHGAYGHRIRNHFGIDQFERAYFALKNNPDSRQIVLQIWDSRLDFPDVQGEPVSDDIPCNVCSLVKVRENKLEWTQIIRSNDIFLGLPYNIVQFTILQEILAGWLDLQLGTYTQISDSLHLYERDRSIISFTSENQCLNTDHISLSKKKTESILKHIYENMQYMVRENLSKSRIIEATQDIGDSAYANIMCIIFADAARRKGWNTLCDELISICTNPVYLQMWSNWLHRVKGKV